MDILNTNLKEYRCDCGKLLFKGLDSCSFIEIKCKRCGQVQYFLDDIKKSVHSFMLVVNSFGKIIDACDGVSFLGHSRQNILGKFLSDILPLARDAQYQEIMPNDGNYQIKNNTLLLRDCKILLESHIIAINKNDGGEANDKMYRTFNFTKEI